MNLTNTTTMSSREIAELTGKDHKHVLADIRTMLESLNIDSAEFSAQYKDSTGRSLPCFNLPKRETLILISGYSVEMRAKIIDRWQALETGLVLPVQQSLTAALDTFNALKGFAEIFGITGNQALLSANKATAKLTGFNAIDTLEITLVSESKDILLTPTELGAPSGLSAMKTNILLQDLGYQAKIGKNWQPTEKGKPFATVLDTHKKHSDGTPVQQVKWSSAMLQYLDPSMAA